MSAAAGAGRLAVAPGARASRRLAGAYRAEQAKLLAQTSTRVAALACVIAPFAFAAVLSRQSGVPADSLLGVWVHSSGYAVGFVVLDFAGYLGFPVLAGIAAGDLFSSEDRYGTWKTLLTRSQGRRELFCAKVLAGCALACALALLGALSSLAGGVLFTGAHPLVDLSGTLDSSGHAALLLLCSWLLSLPPLLGFVAIAILLSVASHSGIVGVCGTIVAGLLMQLLGFLGNGSATHALLLGAAFDDWHGLLGNPIYVAPLAIALAVSAAWIALCLTGAWLLVARREFAGPPVARPPGWLPAARLVLGATAVFVALSAAAALGPSQITAARLQASIAASFEALTVLQQRELGRAVPAGSHLQHQTRCARRSGARSGPGDDWTCAITLVANQPGLNPLSLTEVPYEVSVKANGCYKAESPPSFVGAQTMTAAHGASVVNPLYTIYGCFDTTASPPPCPGATSCSSALGAPAPTTGAPRSLARPTNRVRTRPSNQPRRVERGPGAKVIREQEESERYFEREEREGEGGPSG